MSMVLIRIQDRMSWIGKFMHERKKRIENDIPYIELDFGRSFVQSKFLWKLAQISPANRSIFNNDRH